MQFHFKYILSFADIAIFKDAFSSSSSSSLLSLLRKKMANSSHDVQKNLISTSKWCKGGRASPFAKVGLVQTRNRRLNIGFVEFPSRRRYSKKQYRRCMYSKHRNMRNRQIANIFWLGFSSIVHPQNLNTLLSLQRVYTDSQR